MDEGVGSGPVVVLELDRTLLDRLPSESEVDLPEVDTCLLPLFAGERPLQGMAGLIDWRMSGRLSDVLREGLCTAKAEEAVLLPARRGVCAERIVLWGLGARAEFDEERAAHAGGELARVAGEMGSRSVLVAFPESPAQREPLETLFDALVRGARAWGESADEPEAGAPPEEVEELEAELLEDADESPEDETAGAEQDTRVEGVSAGEAASEGAPDPSSSVANENDEPASPNPELAEEQGAEAGSKGPPPLVVVASKGLAVRLRRVLSGPPRAADGDHGVDGSRL